jgi:NAD(P)-dependent dehydrogenase (short-subunit alcohol dehydrogenase family)
MSSMKESRVHVLVNNACVQWCPLERTHEGHEMHWGVNHLANFAMTQLLMPLLHR